ncbi:MAG: putative conserved small protein [Rhodobacteraceae bacterium HLUCCA12]|nr:MAG: putative conserved small protein [Rhodobacteraceae bacterium HLUCCA12]
MAFLNETIRGTSVLGALRDRLAGLADSWNRYVLFRRTYDELSALSSRELSDLGISRSMITRLAYEAAYGKNA